MTAISGASLPESFAKLGPGGWWERTSPDCCPAPILLMDETIKEDSSGEFSETWPRWGLMRSGDVSRLPPSMPTTGGKGSSSWPTPKASDTMRGVCPSELRRKSPYLPAVAANPHLWPTPTVCGNHNRKGASPTSGDGLATVALKPSQMWPTPVADGDRTTDYAQGGRSLGAEARRAGPEATGDSPTPSPGVLNPEFVEWLMGLPCGWTVLPDSVTASYLSRRRSSGGRSGTRKHTAESSE